MASQPSSGITTQFSATAAKIGAWEEDRQSFFKAIRADDTATADSIIAKYPGEWKAWKSDKGLSPLKVAQDNDNLAVFSLLLDRGADMNESDGRNWTLIATAYKNGQKKIFNCLLERGADLDQEAVTKPKDGWGTPAYTTTLLHMAVVADDKNTIVRLLEHGAKTNITTQHMSFNIPFFHTWGSYCTPASLATKKSKHLLSDIINRASVIRADFLAASAQVPAVTVPAPAPAAPVETGKIEVMSPVQIKRPGTP